MKNYLLLLLCALLFVACEDEDGDGVIQLDCDYVDFKYYNDQPYFLGNMSGDYIFIGFDGSASDTDIANYISGVSLFDQTYSYTLKTSTNYPYKYTVLKFTSAKSCEIMGLAIAFIEQSPLVAYTSYTMETNDCQDWFGYSMGNLCIDTYSSHFYVQVADENDLSDLNLLVSQTNTEFLYQTQFMPEWCVLKATKNSNGDALAMANFFYESGLIEASEPDPLKFAVE